jgi:PAS domain S-box-containing protein
MAKVLTFRGKGRAWIDAAGQGAVQSAPERRNFGMGANKPDGRKVGTKSGNVPARARLNLREQASPQGSCARLKATLDALPDLLFVLDRAGRIYDYHAPSVNRLYVPPKQFLGRTMNEVLPEPAAGIVNRAIADAVKHGHHHGSRYPLPSSDGERWFEISIAAQGNPKTSAGRLVAIVRDITERKRGEEALRESEQKYRLLTEGMKDVVWVLDVEAQRFLYVSPSVEQLRGYTPAEIMAQPLEAAWAPEQREELFKLMRGYVADFLEGKITENTYVPIEFLQPCKDGSTVPSEAVCHLFRNPQTGRIELHGVTRDFTKRKQTEDALRESTDNLRATLNATTDGILAVGPNRKIQFFSQRFAELWNIPPSRMDARDDNILLDHVLAQLSDPDAFLKEVRRLYETDESSFDTIHFKDGRVFERYSFPLRTKLTSAPGRVWSFRDITERNHAEEALKTSETRYRELFDFAVDGILLGSQEGIITNANAYMCALTGRTRAELIGTHVRELFDPKTLDGSPLRFDLLQKGETVTRERKILRQDGSEVFVEMHTKQMPDGTYQSIYRDITERTRAEEALRENEAQRRAINDNLPNGLVYQVDSDVDGQQRRLTYISRGVERLHGITVKEAMRDASIIYEQMLEADRPQLIGREARAVKTLSPFSAEVRVRMPSGEIRWRHFASAPRRLPDGHIVWDGIELDITERKQAEEALKQSESKYRQLHETMRDPLASTNLEGRILDFNPAFQHLLGYSKKKILGMNFRDITPKKWHAREKNIIAEQVRKRGFSAVYEKEYIRKDGSLVPVELRTMLIGDASGKPTGMSAIIRDISERKRNELALRQAHDELERRVAERTADLVASQQDLMDSEEQFRQMAENVQDAFWLIDAKTRKVLYVSPAFKRIWNRPVIKDLTRWFANIHPEDRERVVQAFRNGMKTGIPATVIYRLLWPDGSVRWIESAGSMIRDARGRPIRAAGVIRDITERRRLEADILNAGETERQRIGRDLHDSLGQSLTGIGYLADAVREELVRKAMPEAVEMRKLVRLIGKTADQAHAMAQGLLPVDLNRLGLAPALQELAIATQELFEVPCRYTGPADVRLADVNVASQLYRIAQEAATNAAKHAKTQKIEIRLAKHRRDLLLTVRDTGKGIRSKKHTGAGLGLDIMRYRAGMIGATLWIDSVRNQGTTVNCQLPYPALDKEMMP